MFFAVLHFRPRQRVYKFPHRSPSPRTNVFNRYSCLHDKSDCNHSAGEDWFVTGENLHFMQIEIRGRSRSFFGSCWTRWKKKSITREAVGKHTEGQESGIQWRFLTSYPSVMAFLPWHFPPRFCWQRVCQNPRSPGSFYASKAIYPASGKLISSRTCDCPYLRASRSFYLQKNFLIISDLNFSPEKCRIVGRNS